MPVGPRPDPSDSTAIKDSGIKREELFFTSKTDPSGYNDTMAVRRCDGAARMLGCVRCAALASV